MAEKNKMTIIPMQLIIPQRRRKGAKKRRIKKL
jgi:hypothetical protein